MKNSLDLMNSYTKLLKENRTLKETIDQVREENMELQGILQEAFEQLTVIRRTFDVTENKDTEENKLSENEFVNLRTTEGREVHICESNS
jgi:hypothetical protein